MHPLINDSKYTFDKFLTESREGLGTTKHVLIIYARNTIKEVHVRDCKFDFSSQEHSAL